MSRVVRLDADPGMPVPREVAVSLKNGGLAVCPTDTLYALAASPLSEEGLLRLTAAKNRDPGKPVPLLLSGPEAAAQWTSSIPEAAVRLMRRFWPGALTLVLPAARGLSSVITDGGSTVGLRVPDHPAPRALADCVGGAITGTSANRGGKPWDWESPEEIFREFRDEIDWVLWAGSLVTTAASTVVRVTDENPALLRDGAIPFRDIMEYLQKG